MPTSIARNEITFSGLVLLHPIEAKMVRVRHAGTGQPGV